jgi:hypothetical protein
MLVCTIGLLRPIATGTLRDAVGRSAWRGAFFQSAPLAGCRTPADRTWLALKEKGNRPLILGPGLLHWNRQPRQFRFSIRNPWINKKQPATGRSCDNVQMTGGSRTIIRSKNPNDLTKSSHDRSENPVQRTTFRSGYCCQILHVVCTPSHPEPRRTSTNAMNMVDSPKDFSRSDLIPPRR